MCIWDYGYTLGLDLGLGRTGLDWVYIGSGSSMGMGVGIGTGMCLGTGACMGRHR